MPITTRAELREHLELAIQVELSTVPPYLYALYSIADQRSESALLLRSIVAEEMLHAVLASNVLLAIGGRPRFDTTAYMPRYPGWVPHHKPPLGVRLERCSLALIEDVFMRIEQPEIHGAPAEPDEFETLGQFYHALEEALADMSAREDLFTDPQLECQLSDPSFYAPVEDDAEDSGGLVEVRDLASADDAIEVIVHQGEGLSDERWADPSHAELTHYHKLLQIRDCDSPLGEVRPVPTDPRTADYPESLQPVSDLFNLAYRSLYLLLARLLGPEPDKGPLVGELYRVMTRVMSPVAGFLVCQPIGDGLVAAPTFEVLEGDADQVRRALLDRARESATVWPELRPVAEAMGVR